MSSVPLPNSSLAAKVGALQGMLALRNKGLGMAERIGQEANQERRHREQMQESEKMRLMQMASQGQYHNLLAQLSGQRVANQAANTAERAGYHQGTLAQRGQQEEGRNTRASQHETGQTARANERNKVGRESIQERANAAEARTGESEKNRTERADEFNKRQQQHQADIVAKNKIQTDKNMSETGTPYPGESLKPQMKALDIQNQAEIARDKFDKDEEAKAEKKEATIDKKIAEENKEQDIVERKGLQAEGITRSKLDPNHPEEYQDILDQERLKKGLPPGLGSGEPPTDLPKPPPSIFDRIRGKGGQGGLGEDHQNVNYPTSDLDEYDPTIAGHQNVNYPTSDLDEPMASNSKIEYPPQPQSQSDTGEWGQPQPTMNLLSRLQGINPNQGNFISATGGGLPNQTVNQEDINKIKSQSSVSAESLLGNDEGAGGQGGSGEDPEAKFRPVDAYGPVDPFNPTTPNPDLMNIDSNWKPYVGQARINYLQSKEFDHDINNDEQTELYRLMAQYRPDDYVNKVTEQYKSELPEPDRPLHPTSGPEAIVTGGMLGALKLAGGMGATEAAARSALSIPAGEIGGDIGRAIGGAPGQFIGSQLGGAIPFANLHNAPESNPVIALAKATIGSEENPITSLPHDYIPPQTSSIFMGSGLGNLQQLYENGSSIVNSMYKSGLRLSDERQIGEVFLKNPYFIKKLSSMREALAQVLENNPDNMSSEAMQIFKRDFDAIQNITKNYSQDIGIHSNLISLDKVIPEMTGMLRLPVVKANNMANTVLQEIQDITRAGKYNEDNIIQFLHGQLPESTLNLTERMIAKKAAFALNELNNRLIHIGNYDPNHPLVKTANFLNDRDFKNGIFNDIDFAQHWGNRQLAIFKPAAWLEEHILPFYAPDKKAFAQTVLDGLRGKDVNWDSFISNVAGMDGIDKSLMSLSNHLTKAIIGGNLTVPLIHGMFGTMNTFAFGSTKNMVKALGGWQGIPNIVNQLGIHDSVNNYIDKLGIGQFRGVSSEPSNTFTNETLFKPLNKVDYLVKGWGQLTGMADGAERAAQLGIPQGSREWREFVTQSGINLAERARIFYSPAYQNKAWNNPLMNLFMKFKRPIVEQANLVLHDILYNGYRDRNVVPLIKYVMATGAFYGGLKSLGYNPLDRLIDYFWGGVAGSSSVMSKVAHTITNIPEQFQKLIKGNPKSNVLGALTEAAKIGIPGGTQAVRSTESLNAPNVPEMARRQLAIPTEEQEIKKPKHGKGLRK